VHALLVRIEEILDGIRVIVPACIAPPPIPRQSFVQRIRCVRRDDGDEVLRIARDAEQVQRIVRGVNVGVFGLHLAAPVQCPAPLATPIATQVPHVRDRPIVGVIGVGHAEIAGKVPRRRSVVRSIRVPVREIRYPRIRSGMIEDGIGLIHDFGIRLCVCVCVFCFVGNNFEMKKNTKQIKKKPDEWNGWETKQEKRREEEELK